MQDDLPPAAERRLWDIRTWPRWLKLAVVLVGLSGAAAAGWYSWDSLRQRKTGVIDTLRGLVTAQEQFKQACVVSADRDGTGEYGWLGELAGVDRCRGSGQSMSASPFVRPDLGHKDTRGVSAMLGYRFHLAMPTAERRWQWEPQRVDWRGGRKDADAMEEQWICYAWPSADNLTARRAYFIDHVGEIWSTDCGVVAYRGDDAPRVSAAFVKGGAGRPGSANAPAYTGADGNTWEVLDR